MIKDGLRFTQPILSFIQNLCSQVINDISVQRTLYTTYVSRHGICFYDCTELGIYCDMFQNFPGHSALKRWTRKIDIFSYDLIVIPVHLGMHWWVGLEGLEVEDRIPPLLNLISLVSELKNSMIVPSTSFSCLNVQNT